MLKLMGKEILTILRSKILFIYTYVDKKKNILHTKYFAHLDLWTLMIKKNAFTLSVSTSYKFSLSLWRIYSPISPCRWLQP